MYIVKSGKNVLRKILLLDCYDMICIHGSVLNLSMHLFGTVKAHEEKGTQENWDIRISRSKKAELGEEEEKNAIANIEGRERERERVGEIEEGHRCQLDDDILLRSWYMTPFLLHRHLLLLFHHQRSFSYSLSFDLTYNHQIMFRRDTTGVTEGVRAVRVAQITGDGKEKKREPPSWIFFLHEISVTAGWRDAHGRLDRSQTDYAQYPADNTRARNAGNRSSLSLLLSFLSLSAPWYTRCASCHSISAVDDHE